MGVAEKYTLRPIMLIVIHCQPITPINDIFVQQFENKTKRGKIINKSFGVLRKRNKKKNKAKSKPVKGKK